MISLRGLERLGTLALVVASATTLAAAALALGTPAQRLLAFPLAVLSAGQWVFALTVWVDRWTAHPDGSPHLLFRCGDPSHSPEEGCQ